jgi:tetratricopeptide (TPR) repeat protein
MRLFIYITFLFPVLVVAQSTLSPQVTDSLWNVWQDETQHDTTRLKAIHKYALDGYLFTQSDSAFYYAQLQYDFAKAKGLKKQMADALNTQGVSFYHRGDYAKAIDYYTHSLQLREEIKDQYGIATSLGYIGLIHRNQGDYTKAIDYYTQSLRLREQIGDKKGIAASLNNIGIIYRNQGDYAKAIDYYTQSLKIDEQLENQQGIATSLNNIGIIYHYQGDYAQTINYYTQSLQLYKKLEDQQGIATSLNNIGISYKDKGDYTKAIDFFTQSLQLQEEIGDKQGVVGSLDNIGTIYYNQGDYAKALDYSKRALVIAQQIGAVAEISGAAKSLWEVYKTIGSYKKALEMHELYVTMRDSILSEESQREVIRQEYKYNYEKEKVVDSVATVQQMIVKDAELAKQKIEIKAKRNQQYALFGGLGLVLVFALFMFNRFRVTQHQKQVIEEKEKETQRQKEDIEEKHKEITDSIRYAKRIQNAILPPQKTVKKWLPESFIFYKPKDVVAGDFYWLETSPTPTIPKGEGVSILFAAADCTGHGVPGAMVSVVCNNGLNRSVREHGITDPGKILDKTRKIVISEFEKSEEDVKDGMDIALCKLEILKDKSQKTKLQYAGANNPLWIIRKAPSVLPSADGEGNPHTSHPQNKGNVNENSSPSGRLDGAELIEYKPNKQPIGKTVKPKPFTTHSIELQKGDTIYIFTDGFADQFGGPKGKKFMYKPFKELLLSIQEKTMEEQKIMLEQHFENWKGGLEQIDDVCVIGVRI